MSYKHVEHYSPEYLDQIVDHGDKPLVENTKKEYTEETIEQNGVINVMESGRDVIKFDLERVVMGQQRRNIGCFINLDSKFQFSHFHALSLPTYSFHHLSFLNTVMYASIP
ncbi:hypothetical protein TNCV_3473831 [Trichonephila clavipes]|nr:hypothetical protein TNCV_3473831 [Trichonephila clavipes]